MVCSWVREEWIGAPLNGIDYNQLQKVGCGKKATLRGWGVIRRVRGRDLPGVPAIVGVNVKH
jgi:hypothetical protein